MTFKTIAAVVAISAGAIATPAIAKDPCQSFICMAGMVAGSQAGGCSQGISDFFSINVFKRGSFRGGPTADARRDFLNQCPGTQEPANQAQVSAIISKFGSVRR